jgi:Dolichyl-phosphate-mannose-protein mannosyltransferase
MEVVTWSTTDRIRSRPQPDLREPLTDAAISTSGGGRLRAAMEISGLLTIFAAAVAFVAPHGNFPLNDDGSFALPTFEFARSGEFHLVISAAPSLRAQVVWGSLFVRAFGASYDVLRASTLVLAALAIILVNRIMARVGLAAGARVISTLTFAFAPIFLWSASTFMTEVPFIFASALAFYLYLRGLQENSAAWLVAAGCAVALSWWVRQTGIITAISPIILLIVYRDRLDVRWRRDLGICAIPVAVFAAIYATRPEWLMGSAIEFKPLYHMWSEETFRLPEQIALVYHYFLYSAQGVALCFLPLVVGCGLSWRRSRWDLAVLGSAVVVATFGMTRVVAGGTPFPYYGRTRACCDLLLGNVFNNFGLGPPTLTDVWNGHYEYPFHLGYPAHVALTYASGLAAAVLVWIVVKAARAAVASPRDKRCLLILLAATHALLHTAGLCVSAAYFDRYAIDSAWTVIFILPFFVAWPAKRARMATIVTVAAVALFTVLSVQEYFAWNRARWTAYWNLRRAGVALTSIDGGSEAFTTFELVLVKDARTRRRMAFGAGRRPYLITFHPLPGTRVVARYPFSGWFGTHRGFIYAVEDPTAR